MARVFKRAPSAYASRGPSRTAKRKNRRHKVVMETVTQEKKKLRSVISFEAKAPPGYTFIPAGNPQFTTACKETCRKDGRKVFAVTTTPHMRAHDLSQHVHRIGYHFPSNVVSTVCMDLGLYLTTTGKVVPIYSVGGNVTRRRSDSEVSQITVNTEARDVIRDLFPNIPDRDLNQIIKTAFQKGQRKVGTAAELPLARRAQLAVVAHIRHLYTDYDGLLKRTSFHEARSSVEEPTLAKLVEWRGDDENGRKVLEDVFREVIVISNDEDSDIEDEPVPTRVNRDNSVEIVSIASNARPEEVHTKPLDYEDPLMSGSLRDLSDDEAPPGFRFVPETPKKSKIDRRGFSRYQAWDRAINRYRNGLVTNQNKLVNNTTNQKEPPYHVRQPSRQGPRVGTEPAARKAKVSRPASVSPFAVSKQRNAGSCMGGPLPAPEEGRSYELHRLATPTFQRGRNVVHLGGHNDASIGRDLVSWPERVAPLPGGYQNTVVVDRLRDAYRNDQLGRRYGAPVNRESVNPQDRALPSIEVAHSPSSRARRLGGEGMERTMPANASVYPVMPSRHPHGEVRQANNDTGLDDTSDRVPKRRRLAYDQAARNVYGFPDGSSGAGGITAPAVHSVACPSPRHVPQGPIPGQGDPYLRRKYGAPDDRTYLAPLQLERSQDQTHSTHNYYNPDTGYPVDRRLTKDFDGRAFVRHQPVSYACRRSPKPALPQASSGVGYSVPVEETTVRTGYLPPNHFSDTRTRHAICDPKFDFDFAAPSAATQSKFPTWWNRTAVRSDDVYSREIPYFGRSARPVDLQQRQQQQIPSFDYTTQFPEIQVSRVRQPFHEPSSVRTRSDGNGNGNELSNGAASFALHNKPYWDTREVRPARDYVVHQPYDPTYQRSTKLHDFNPASRHYGRECGGPLGSERPAYQHPRIPEQSHPFYVRRPAQPPSHSSMSEGNTVIIVD